MTTTDARHRIAGTCIATLLAIGAVSAAATVHDPPSRPARVAHDPTGSTVAIVTTTAPTTTTTSTTAVPTGSTTTVQRPPPPPAPPVGDVEAAIARAFGPEHYAEALRVARCESSLNPSARSGDHVGLFQLSTRYHAHRAVKYGYTWEQVAHEAYPNAVVAAEIYREQGWRPWSCRP